MISRAVLTQFVGAIALGILVPLTASAQSQCHDADPKAPALVADQWRYATDPHGSEAVIKESLLTDGVISIAFTRVPRVDANNNSWVELIYDLPKATLSGVSRVKLEYQSSTDLVLKLSQNDYGGEGDGSYAHYQHALPASTVWRTQCVAIDDFQRPEWTPSSSKDIGVIKNNVAAIYVVPELSDEHGGKSRLKIKSITLLP